MKKNKKEKFAPAADACAFCFGDVFLLPTTRGARCATSASNFYIQWPRLLCMRFVYSGTELQYTVSRKKKVINIFELLLHRNEMHDFKSKSHDRMAILKLQC